MSAEPALPLELPGAREEDAALGVDALDAIRKQIAAHVDATQGAWARSSPWKRAWPLALGVVAAAAWVGLVPMRGGAVGVAAGLAFAAAICAFIAVGRAPLHPGWAERAAQVALAGGALAFAAEIGFSLSAPPVDAGDGWVCARGIVLGALLPTAFLALYVRRSGAPARLFHVVAVAAATLLASAAAVWAECASTLPSHVLVSHVAAPIGAAALAIAIVRPLLRSPPCLR